MCSPWLAAVGVVLRSLNPPRHARRRYVRNTTARAFSVVASALGIPALLPFLKAVCQSKKSWQARHTGIKIVQQISILMGCAVLPHLKVRATPPQTGRGLPSHCTPVELSLAHVAECERMGLLQLEQCGHRIFCVSFSAKHGVEQQSGCWS